MRKLIAITLCLLLVGEMLPLGGFAFLSGQSVSAASVVESQEGKPDNWVDYSNLSVNQYMAKVLLNYDYVGAANEYNAELGTIPQCHLRTNLSDTTRADTAKMLVDMLREKDAFMASVAAWKVATFNPANMTDDILDEKGYYTAIIFSILDAQMNDSIYLQQMNNEYGELGRTTFSIAAKLAENFSDMDAKNLQQELNSATKSQFIDLLVKQTVAETDKEFYKSFGQGVSFVTTALNTYNSAEDVANALCSYMMIAQMSDDIKAVLKELYDCCDPANIEMKSALYEAYVVCSDELNAAIVGVIEAGAEVVNMTFSAVTSVMWDACITSALGTVAGGALIAGQIIGKTISNFCFSTDSIIEQYYAMSAVVEFEKLMTTAVKSLGNKFKSNPNEANADAFIQSIGLLFSLFDLADEYALEYVKIVTTEGLANKLKLWGKETPLPVYEEGIAYHQEVRKIEKEGTLNIENYAIWYEIDAPSAYAKLFTYTEEAVKPPVYVKEEEVTYFEPTFDPVRESVCLLNYTINADGTATVTGCSPFTFGAVTIPTEVAGYPVKTIGINAFQRNQSVTGVEIPGSVTRIEMRAFSGCNNLKTVTLNHGLKEIGGAAFEDTALIEITIPKTVEKMHTYMHWGPMGNMYDCSAFKDADALKTVNFEYGILRIPQYALRDCTSVTRVVIPNGVMAIESAAFSGCTALTEITMPDSVIAIRSGAFSGCAGLVSVKIPEGVRTIETAAFYGCSGLIDVEMPIGVTHIEDRAFGECNSLTTMEMPAGVVKLGTQAFEGCANLKTVTLNDGLKEIGGAAFDGTALTEITIPKTVEKMHTDVVDGSRLYCSALNGANALKTVVFQYGIPCIPQYALHDCTSVTRVVIPNGVTSIEGAAFYGCTALTEITIPDSVITFEESSLYGCDNLHTMYVVKNTEAYRVAEQLGVHIVEITCTHAHTDLQIESIKSCTQNGVKHMVCTTCQAVVSTEVQPAQGHNYMGKITETATCGKMGVITYICDLCGDKYTEEYPATEKHIYDDEYDAECNVCGDIREVQDKPALPEDAPAFVVENTTACVGEIVTVAIRTKRNSGIVSFKLNIAYDANVLELISVAEGDFSGMSFSPMRNNPFIVNWVDAIHPNNTTDGVVVCLTFQVKESAPGGGTAITLSYDSENVYDQNYDNVGFAIVNGTVTVADYVPGDINDDGKINNKDLGLLQQYLNDWDVSIVEKAADTNGDGKLNNKDLGLLQQYLNDWDVTLG